MVMYQEHFGLARPPFSMHPDPAFLYLSEQHSSAKAFLESSALVNDSFVVITGSIGAGKTTLVEGFVSELPAATTVIARINQTQLSATGFLQLLLDDLGLKAFKTKKPQLLARLSNFLGTCEREGKSVVVVVDEAQNLSRAVLEEIRLLTGSKNAACLSIVLVGQPEFLEMLESPKLRQLAQRCRLRSHLAALDEPETHEYIAHRLAIAGAAENEIFTKQALRDVFVNSGGVPRLINNLCDTALICAFADGLTTVDENVVAAAMNELKWQPPTDGTMAPAIKQQSEKQPDSNADIDVTTEALDSEKDTRIRTLEAALTSEQEKATAAQDQWQQAESELARLKEAADSLEAHEQQLRSRQQRLADLSEQLAPVVDADQVETTDADDTSAETLIENLDLLDSQLRKADSLIDSVENEGKRDDEAVAQADGKIAELLEQLATYRSEQEALQTELDNLKATATTAIALESSLAAAQTEIADLQAAKEKLVNDANQHCETTAEDEVRISDLQRELEAANHQAQYISADKEKLEGELAASATELDEAKQRLARCDATLQEKSAEIAALKETGTGLKQELEQTRSQLAATEERIPELEKSNEISATRISRLEEKIDSRDHSIRTLEAEVRRKNKLIDELHDQLQSLPEINDRVETLGAENFELRNDLDSKMHRIVELEEALSLSQQQHDDARHELDNSHNEHVGLHKEIAEHKSQLAELQKGTSMRDDLVKSLTVECQNRKQDLRRLRSELDESLDQSRELRDSVKIGEERARELEAELQAAMETIREMNESGYAASTEAREVSAELAERQRQVTTLQEQLQEKETALLSVTTTLKEKTETIKVLQMDAEVSGLHKQSDAETAGNVAHGPLVTQLRSEIEARDRCIEELESSLSTSSEALARLTSRMEKQDLRVNELEEQLESSRMAAAELREEVGRADREFDETAFIEDDSTESTSRGLQIQALGADLLVSTNGHPARRVPLRSERLIIGRTRDSDIKIDDESASRHHAQIIYDNGRFFVEDLNSTNGILVNSRRVKRRRLRNRDIISIGRDRMIFVLEQHTSH